jgi:lipopolysaccharide export system protein LptC
LLAGLTFWLQSGFAADDQPDTTASSATIPDAIAENFVARRFDQAGQLKYRPSTAPYLVHYPDDDTSEINLADPGQLPRQQRRR